MYVQRKDKAINCECRVSQEQDEDSNRWKLGHVESGQQKKEIMDYQIRNDDRIWFKMAE